MPKYVYDDAVLKFASKNQVPVDALDNMLDRAARISHDQGNRRYHDWVFDVEGKIVKKMGNLQKGCFSAKIPSSQPMNPDQFIVWEDCEICEGDGCQSCNYEGAYRLVRQLTKPKLGVMN